jgi:hypothetical protein
MKTKKNGNIHVVKLHTYQAAKSPRRMAARFALLNIASFGFPNLVSI